MLTTIFSADFGFPEEMAISLYKEGLQSSGKLEEMREELIEAFKDESISWKDMLFNEEYEVLDVETDEEAKEYIKKMLWDPINE